MDDHELAAQLLQNHFTATAALIALMLKNLPADVRTRTLDAVRSGTGKVELRTRVESNETELVLMLTDGSEVLWLARTPAYFR
jgi:Mg-chelatase subunit ChlD